MKADHVRRRAWNAGVALLLLAALLASASQATAASAVAPNQRVPVSNPYVLINHCQQVAATAHPWRAKQIDSAIVRYRLAMSYRGAMYASDNLNELAKMRASEIRAADNLAETCRIDPSAASTPPSSPPLPPR